MNRKKFNYIILPFVAFALFVFLSINSYKTKAEAIYKLITDANGITWQYSYLPEEKSLEVSFFDTENDVNELVIPDKNYFISNDDSIDEINSYSFIDYESHDLGVPREFNSTITKLDLSNVDIVDGIKPLAKNNSSTNPLEVIFNPNGTIIGFDVFRNLHVNVINIDKVTDIFGGAFYATSFVNANIDLSSLETLGDGSFEKSNIKSVKINAEEIGVSAFKTCNYLTTVELLDNVLHIMDSAFEGDRSLKNFVLNNTEIIGNLAFKDCNAFSVDLKDTNIRYIGAAAFLGCSFNTLDTLTMPANVTTINWRTFSETNITSLNLRNVTVVGDEAFRDCRRIKNINFGNVQRILYRAFINDSNIRDLSFSNSVYEINAQAFDNCNINNLNLNQVQKIDYGAFANNNISDLYLPKSLSVMETAAIWYNNPITKITIAFDTMSNKIRMLWVLLDHDSSPSASDYYDANYDGSKYLETIELVAPYASYESPVINSKYSVSRDYTSDYYYPNSYEQNLVNNCKNVLRANFLNNLPVKTVKLGEGYEFLGGGQFNEWNSNNSRININQVVLPSSLIGIGKYAFLKVKNYFDINFPSKLQYIGENAFLYATGLTKNIDIPSLTYIGPGAFMFSNITGITLSNKLQYIGKNAANLTPRLKTIIVDCDFYQIIRNSNEGESPTNEVFPYFFPTSYSYWGSDTRHNGHYDLIRFTEKAITNPRFTENNDGGDGGAFQNLDVTTFDLGNAKFTDLGPRTFIDSNINSLTLPKTLTTINKWAFHHTTVTVPIVLPDTVTVLDDYSFFSSDVYVASNLPSSLKTIGCCALLDTVFNDNLFIPSTVTSIGHAAFQGGHYSNHRHLNMKRNSVFFNNHLDSTVTNGDKIVDLLKDCSVNELIFGTNVTELPTSSMNDYSYSEFSQMDFKKVTFYNIKKIPDKAFIECKNLTEVDMSRAANLTDIGAYAFIDTPSLKKVNIRSGLNLKIGGFAFMKSGLETIGDYYSGLNVNDNNITLNGPFVFSNMPYLYDVNLTGTFNNGVIPKGTFYYDPRLTKVVLDHNFKKIGTQAFANNSNLKTFVMYGNTEIENDSKPQKLLLDNVNSIDFSLQTDKTDFTVKINDPNNGNSTITYNDFENKNFEYNKNTTLNSIVLETSDDIFLDNTEQNQVVIRNISDDTLTIDSHANLYCYLKNESCNKFNNTYRNLKESNNSDLYYLDEVLYLDSNKHDIDMDDNNNILTDDLSLYALRRDGVILVSEEWKKMTDSKKFVDSGITISDYDSSTVDPKKMVFNTTVPLEEVDVKTNDNFENIEYVVGSRDPVTNRINIQFKYINKIVDTAADTTLNTVGNVATIIYSDGCGGQSFANVIYDNVLIGDATPIYSTTPVREGYTFVGWNKEIADKVTGSVTYVAMWKKIDPVYPPPSIDPVDNNQGVSITDNIRNILTNPKTLHDILIIAYLIVVLLGIGIFYRKREIK